MATKKSKNIGKFKMALENFVHRSNYDFDLPKLYKDYFFNTRCSTIELQNIASIECKKLFLNTNKITFLDEFHIYAENNDAQISKMISVYVLANKSILYFNEQTKSVDVSFLKENIQHYMELCQQFLKFSLKNSDEKEKPNISILSNRGNHLHINNFEITHNPIDLNLNYNTDFGAIHKIIVDKLSSNNSKGIVLLHGESGTGKTTYIKHLISLVSKTIVFIPINIVDNLSSPNMMDLLLKHKNSVLVIEDAEKIITKRDGIRNSVVSSLLNLTDGLLSEILNIQVICTFNTQISNIDDALLRKGRLIAKYNFRKLETTQANKLSNKLGIHKKYNTPTKLVDVYYANTINFSKQTEKNKIGFNKNL